MKVNLEASSYIQIIFIVCCFLLTAPNQKKKIISVSYGTNGIFWVCITASWLVHNRN